MQDMRDALPSSDNQPVTGLCIVADPVNTPPGYSIIDKTYDRREDADLWKDRFFGRRITRYMCVENSASDTTKDVLVDMTVINERDTVPPGYQCLEHTKDTAEKAQKKRQLCLRWMNRSLTMDAVCEVMLMRRGGRPPAGFTLVGELNNLQLCFKMASIPQVPSPSSTSQVPTPTTTTGPASHPTGVRTNGLPATQLPYAVNPQVPVTGTTLQRSAQSVAANPLSGIPWQLNHKLTAGSSVRTNDVHDIPFKSYSEIENQYSYAFTIEHSAAARMPPELC